MYRAQVKTYFDSLASSYAKRLGADSPFRAYYFDQRLRIACQGLSLEEKYILDVGAGTGALFDFLKSEKIDIRNYLALDISANMLDQSKIPPAQRIVGGIGSINQREKTFDYIFLLGVSTYMPIPEIEKVIKFASQYLSLGGQLIISFTYRLGLDFQIRRGLRPVISRILPGQHVLQQPFPITALTPKEVQAIPAPLLKLVGFKWLPPVLPGLHHFFSRLAVKISKSLNRPIYPYNRLRLLRTDFIAFWEKKEGHV